MSGQPDNKRCKRVTRAAAADKGVVEVQEICNYTGKPFKRTLGHQTNSRDFRKDANLRKVGDRWIRGDEVPLEEKYSEEPAVNSAPMPKELPKDIPLFAPVPDAFSAIDATKTLAELASVDFESDWFLPLSLFDSSV